MKQLLYKLINRLGYHIESKNTRRSTLINDLSEFKHLKNFNLIVQAKNFILNLEKKHEDFKIINQKEGFLVSFSDLNIYVESLEEFNILNEVFVNTDYGFVTNEKSILIDIGVNIGITSLFFSKYDYIDKIYGFEPVEPTFNQANYNLELNKNIHKVVRLKNIGLGRNNRNETFLFDGSVKGNTGIRGKLSPSYSKNPHSEQIQVEIRDASTEITKILTEIKNRKIIVKMDCEGAEYEILENLMASGILDQIDAILLEWHDEGYDIIKEMLLKAGFEFFTNEFGLNAGMVYAYKIK